MNTRTKEKPAPKKKRVIDHSETSATDQKKRKTAQDERLEEEEHKKDVANTPEQHPKNEKVTNVPDGDIVEDTDGEAVDPD